MVNHATIQWQDCPINIQVNRGAVFFLDKKHNNVHIWYVIYKESKNVLSPVSHNLNSLKGYLLYETVKTVWAVLPFQTILHGAKALSVSSLCLWMNHTQHNNQSIRL